MTLYSASVPVFQHYLQCLRTLVDVADNYEQSTGKPVLKAALAEDMFGFAQQVTIACGFTVRACCPLLGLEPPQLAGGDRDWTALRERIDATLLFLAQVDPDAIAGAEEVPVQTTAGFATHNFSGADFVSNYAMPNFFFHLCMAHAILRSQGVPVGKQDFDGFHAYPSGFSFLSSPEGKG